MAYNFTAAADAEATEINPRTIAAEWRRHPERRLVIEAQIEIGGMQALFTRGRDGALICRLSPADWKRITASGGGAYSPASLRREHVA